MDKTLTIQKQADGKYFLKGTITEEDLRKRNENKFNSYEGALNAMKDFGYSIFKENKKIEKYKSLYETENIKRYQSLYEKEDKNWTPKDKGWATDMAGVLKYRLERNKNGDMEGTVYNSMNEIIQKVTKKFIEDGLMKTIIDTRGLKNYLVKEEKILPSCEIWVYKNGNEKQTDEFRTKLFTKED